MLASWGMLAPAARACWRRGPPPRRGDARERGNSGHGLASRAAPPVGPLRAPHARALGSPPPHPPPPIRPPAHQRCAPHHAATFSTPAVTHTGPESAVRTAPHAARPDAAFFSARAARVPVLATILRGKGDGGPRRARATRLFPPPPRLPPHRPTPSHANLLCALSGQPLPSPAALVITLLRCASCARQPRRRTRPRGGLQVSAGSLGALWGPGCHRRAAGVGAHIRGRRPVWVELPTAAAVATRHRRHDRHCRRRGRTCSLTHRPCCPRHHRGGTADA